MILTEILEKNAKVYPDRVACRMKIGYRTVLMTYREAFEWSLRLACFLEKQGINSGDKVLLLAPNSPYWICVFWGTLLRGAVLVPLNIQSTSETVKKIADQTQAKILFKHLNYHQLLPSRLKIYNTELIPELLSPLDYKNFKKAQAQEADLIEIMYTSGTTGDPKGVMLTHRNVGSNAGAVSRAIPINAKDKFLSILPLSHIFEQVAGFLVPFSAGAEIIYAHSPAAIKDLMRECQVTHLAAVPEFLRLVMNKIEARASGLLNFAGKTKNKSLRRLVMYPVLSQFGGRLHTVASGGAPLEGELEKKWEALGITLLQGYGLTETSPVISTNTYEAHKLGTVGKVLPGVEVKTAEDGEILVKGPNVFGGYYQKDAKTRGEVFTAEGWFKTGDIGQLDKDGFLFLKGRKKYMILGPGGQNVFSEDIEFELNKIPGVKDSCVVGLEKPGGQVEIHAVLLGDDIKDAPSLINLANQNLASYQQITGFTIWPSEDFPRSATRKVKKEEVLKFLRTKAEARPTLPAQKGALEQILAEITGVDPAKIDKDTKIVPELNLDSLLRVELVTRIEEKFAVAIEEARITPATTVAEVEQMIKIGLAPRSKIKFKTWPLSFWAQTARRLGHASIFPLIWGRYITLAVQGQENLRDLQSPVVFMPNHLSYLDSLVVRMILPPRFRSALSYAAAQDIVYGEYKFWAWVSELFFNCFPFPRQEGENIKLGLEYFGKMLDHGCSVVIYPEGRQSPDGRLLPLKRGAGLVAVEMNCPIVPVKITGTNLVQPPDRILPRRRGPVTVKFGRSMKFSRQDSYLEATRKIQETLRMM